MLNLFFFFFKNNVGSLSSGFKMALTPTQYLFSLILLAVVEFYCWRRVIRQPLAFVQRIMKGGFCSLDLELFRKHLKSFCLFPLICLFNISDDLYSFPSSLQLFWYLVIDETPPSLEVHFNEQKKIYLARMSGREETSPHQ